MRARTRPRFDKKPDEAFVLCLFFSLRPACLVLIAREYTGELAIFFFLPIAENDAFRTGLLRQTMSTAWIFVSRQVSKIVFLFLWTFEADDRRLDFKTVDLSLSIQPFALRVHCHTPVLLQKNNCSLICPSVDLILSGRDKSPAFVPTDVCVFIEKKEERATRRCVPGNR